MAEAPLPIEPVLRSPGPGTRTRWASRVVDVVIRSIVPVILALVAGGILLLALAATRSPSTGHLEGRRRERRLAGQRGPDGAAAPDRRRADRRLPREHLEPRLQRPVPARRRLRLGLGAVARERRAALARVHAAVSDRGRRRRGLDAHPGVPEGVLRNERDHHDADDVVHRDRHRQHPDQGAVPGSAIGRSADDACSRSTRCCRTFRGRGSTAACSSPSRRCSSSTTC